MPAHTSIRVSARISGFTYAIRNIVAEARKVEASGRPVRYLNIGDPIPFGFKTPPHLVEAAARAMRAGHNGYTASVGIDLADHAGVPILADEVYGDLGFDGPSPLLGSLAPDAPIISFSSLSKAYLAPGWRAGWLAIGRSDRLDDMMAAIKKLADGRLCS